MTTQTLSRVTLQTVENYRTAATQAVVAYRLGGHRLVGVLNGALKKSVYPRTAKLAPRVTHHMNEVRGNVSKIVVKGIDRVAERTEHVIESTSTTAAAQVNKMASFAAKVDNEVVADGLQVAARLTMPGAKVALALSGRLARRANALADAAGASAAVRTTARKPAARAKGKAAPVARKAKAAVKTATKRLTKVARTAPAPVAKARRAPRAAKKAVVEAVAA